MWLLINIAQCSVALTKLKIRSGDYFRSYRKVFQNNKRKIHTNAKNLFLNR